MHVRLRRGHVADSPPLVGVDAVFSDVTVWWATMSCNAPGLVPAAGKAAAVASLYVPKPLGGSLLI